MKSPSSAGVYVFVVYTLRYRSISFRFVFKAELDVSYLGNCLAENVDDLQQYCSCGGLDFRWKVSFCPGRWFNDPRRRTTETLQSTLDPIMIWATLRERRPASFNGARSFLHLGCKFGRVFLYNIVNMTMRLVSTGGLPDQFSKIVSVRASVVESVDASMTRRSSSGCAAASQATWFK